MISLLCALIPLIASVTATPKKTLVIIGDSLTTGQGVGIANAYPTVLQHKLDCAGKAWTVVAAGINGSLTASAAARTEAVLPSKPDLLVLALGGNDGLRQVPLATIEANLARALTVLKEARVKTLLVGLKVPPGFDPTFAANVDRMFLRLATRFDVPLLASMLEGVAGLAQMNQADGYHPNVAGHLVIANTMYRALDPLL